LLINDAAKRAKCRFKAVARHPIEHLEEAGSDVNRHPETTRHAARPTKCGYVLLNSSLHPISWCGSVSAVPTSAAEPAGGPGSRRREADRRAYVATRTRKPASHIDRRVGGRHLIVRRVGCPVAGKIDRMVVGDPARNKGMVP
jgi:hypothetical protein